MKKPGEMLLELLIRILGWSSSLIVILIVLFLFREGLGLFSASVLTERHVLIVNPENPIREWDANKIHKVTREEVTNWKDLGWKNIPIQVLTTGNLEQFIPEAQGDNVLDILPHRIDSLFKNNPGLIGFIPERYAPQGYVPVETGNLSVNDFFLGTRWYPTSDPAPEFGALPIILGSLWVTLGAVLFALPLGLATAIYMAEIANKRIASILKPIVELMAGIPSVVFGFFGLVVIVPLIKEMFGLAVGETALAGSILLGIIALPTVITIAEDAIRSTPYALKEASLGMGATHWQTLVRVIIPASFSGISAAVILGVGRAIGETMAVLMVTGNAAVLPHTFLSPVRTLPATIAAELGEAPVGGTHYRALFLVACVLFLLSLGINLIVNWIQFNAKQKEA
ncbi:MAG: phosphate ABC transporter permease subunit PstC [Sphingobacteriia bacterium]|nr:phosphate ABC transporter permease subunit PstC [Sphingobacteriia bacterium]